ncbi:hypothetical protein WA1_02795 [Scytonema hofmannii PCC 7110]|uniref:Uncharacterized protein n=1 Tax=Scytonema hofmannii PCC 7110 TaxID=128403 RepID=A0A139XHB2_9CYAN|nr:hypothetical protein [Scytonema hofmannii]KYC44086.1 hypothetical protein WA1_02795 [Scytonema hofmannii PCC 7110]
MPLLEKDKAVIVDEIIKDDIKQQKNNINEIIKKLEENFQSKDIQLQDLEFLDFQREIIKLRKALDKVASIQNKVSDLEDDIENQIKAQEKIYYDIYKILDLIKERYREFFPDKLIDNLEDLKNRFGWKRGLLNAGLLLHESTRLSKLNYQSGAEKYYKALVLLLQSLEKYYLGSSTHEIEVIKKLASEVIEREKTIKRREDKKEKYHTLLRKLLNVSKSILWEIENQQNKNKPTVQDLLTFLEKSPKWIGDDFEECLEYINEVRRQ